MHEMLGNHHFLLKDYVLALAHYEAVLSEEKASTAVRKRAIVCYIQTHQVDEALPLFADLIAEDIRCIIGHDNEKEGCPCPEIIQEYESRMTGSPSQNDLTAMGMLWLYCEPNKSLQWFDRALQQDPNNPYLSSIFTTLANANISSAQSHHSHKEE
jgi:tetratricopeptide (TPR) repeat protein